ncbi:hypothetical protein FOZ62_017266, partial [Perkinsus olseni]
CIVDEVVIVCQHRKTATVAASKALAELSARKSSTATWTRGVQTAPQKSGRFEPKFVDSSAQTDDGHAGTEMEIERYLERERSDGLASLDGESGPFTLHCSVNSALNRSHTGALREKEASPSPASPRVTEAA